MIKTFITNKKNAKNFYRNMSAIRDRICQFIDSKNISRRTFAKKTGISANYLSFDSEIKSDILLKIYTCFPEISLVWLITGKGPMINEEKSEKSNNDLIATNRNLSESNLQLANSISELIKKMQNIATTAVAEDALVTEAPVKKIMRR